jgi:hypothetical protein
MEERGVVEWWSGGVVEWWSGGVGRQGIWLDKWRGDLIQAKYVMAC